MTRHPIIGATLAMLVYACALSAAEWQPEREANGAIADAGRICLGMAAFWEARGESPEGQACVAAVAIGRAKDAGTDFCTVVLEAGQFQGIPPPPRMPWRIDSQAWDAALVAADDAIAGRALPECGRARWFGTASAPAPTNADVVTRIGNHIFYAPPVSVAGTAGNGGAITAKE